MAIFRRSDIALDMTKRLLHPSPLDEQYRSGVFLSGPRRIGKTTFLKNDLIPQLEQEGAIVIYVDLWSDPRANPASLVHSAIRQTLTELAEPASGLLATLRQVKGVNFGDMDFNFGINLETLGQPEGITLSEAFRTVVDMAKTDVVLIIDEVPHAITTEDGLHMMTALKSARDAINLRPNSPGCFLFVGTGSHRTQVHEMTVRRNHAFQGAATVEYPKLGREYVDFLLGELQTSGIANLPAPEVVMAGFDDLGRRPEELLKALRKLNLTKSALSPDVVFPIITSTLRSAAADIEIARVNELGALAVSIFDFLAHGGKGIYAADTLQRYKTEIGRIVPTDEVQSVMGVLQDNNLIMRLGHGQYAITNDFVKDVWVSQASDIGGKA